MVEIENIGNPEKIQKPERFQKNFENPEFFCKNAEDLATLLGGAS
jgi:hypothetical protein